jgi:hypothetical protein
LCSILQSERHASSSGFSLALVTLAKRG